MNTNHQQERRHMDSFSKSITPFIQRMREEHLPEIVIDNFIFYYRKLWKGETGMVPENLITPVQSLDNAENLSQDMEKTGENMIPKTVIIKLNGGLGTSMGMKTAKSLLTVKGQHSFLDIIVRQARTFGADVPVVFMNSFSTQKETLKALEKYPFLGKGISLDFLQHKIPKIVAEDLGPAGMPGHPALEWCPPGHGDIYPALMTSGILDELLKAGCEYAFISNADNLGAVLEPSILGYFIDHKLSFMMEAADRTRRDKKGGHPALLKSGDYILREIAQCPEGDMASFQDIRRHKYFNTNNIWIHLPALKKILTERKGILGLPMIRNRKPLNPREPNSTPVYQLETAMGAAISVFDSAGVIRVSRNRFAPVKDTGDLLAVRSDCYILDDKFNVVLNPQRKTDRIVIDLDPKYYKIIDDFEARFPWGAPSLLQCESLRVRGDFVFGSGVTLKGSVSLENKGKDAYTIENGCCIEGHLQV